MKILAFARCVGLTAFLLPACLQGGMIVSNLSFETPLLSAGDFVYNPTGVAIGWSFVGASGIAATGSPWFNVGAPDGAQAAFLQANTRQDPTAGSFSQLITGLTAGDIYQISFDAALRSTVASYPVDVFTVSLDGMSLGSFAPASTSFALNTTSSIMASATSETLLFQSISNGTIDRVSIVDFVTITDLGPSAPEPNTFFLFVPALSGLAVVVRRRLKA